MSSMQAATLARFLAVPRNVVRLLATQVKEDKGAKKHGKRKGMYSQREAEQRHLPAYRSPVAAQTALDAPPSESPRPRAATASILSLGGADTFSELSASISGESTDGNGTVSIADRSTSSQSPQESPATHSGAHSPPVIAAVPPSPSAVPSAVTNGAALPQNVAARTPTLAAVQYTRRPSHGGLVATSAPLSGPTTAPLRLPGPTGPRIQGPPGASNIGFPVARGAAAAALRGPDARRGSAPTAAAAGVAPAGQASSRRQEVKRNIFAAVRREDILLSVGCVLLIICSIVVVTVVRLNFVTSARHLGEFLDHAITRVNYSHLMFMRVTRYILAAADLQADPTNATLVSTLAEYHEDASLDLAALEASHSYIMNQMPELDADQYAVHFSTGCVRQVGATCPPDRFADYLLNGLDTALRYYFASLHEILDADYADVSTSMPAYQFVRYADLSDISPNTYTTTTWVVNAISELGASAVSGLHANSLIVGAVVIVALGMVMPFILRVSRQEAQIDTMVSMIGILELSKFSKPSTTDTAPTTATPPAPAHEALWHDIDRLEAARSARRSSVTFA
jgi:hypothetical protein